MGGMKLKKLIFAELMIQSAIHNLAEADERIAEAYSATHEDAEGIGAAMVLTPEFEIAWQRMDKLKSELEAIQDIIVKAEEL